MLLGLLFLAQSTFAITTTMSPVNPIDPNAPKQIYLTIDVLKNGQSNWNPCTNYMCPMGEVCQSRQVQCYAPPCYPIAQCVPQWLLPYSNNLFGGQMNGGIWGMTGNSFNRNPLFGGMGQNPYTSMMGQNPYSTTMMGQQYPFNMGQLSSYQNWNSGRLSPYSNEMNNMNNLNAGITGKK